MPNPFRQARDDLVAKLLANGVPRATVDPGANPPFVLVGLITINSPRGGVGAWAGDVDISIVVPPPGDLDALTALEDVLAAVLAVTGYAPAVPDTYALSPTATAPAYVVTLPIDVPNPNC